MSAFDGTYLDGKPEAQRAWRQRQIRITLEFLAGARIAELAEQEGVTSGRIRQILQMACIHSFRLPKRRVQLPQDKDYLSVASLRTHKEFWRGRLRALERVWGVPRTEVQHRDADEGRAAAAT